MKGLKFILPIVLSSIVANAFEQKELSLPSACEARIIDSVTNKYGQGDETFSVVKVKLLYGGVFKGFGLPVVALVRTSDEVEPRDVLVTTGTPKDGKCRIERIQTLADGMVISDSELDY